jgi:hypothetical protein
MKRWYVNDELEGIWKEAVMALFEGTTTAFARKNTKNLNQESLSPGRYLNPGPHEYEARLLKTKPRRSVQLLLEMT